ncbi:MAG: undecaprenyl-diphosphatase [Candidatus Nitrosomirales archaeon]|jgi:undecaprenyl-diphosphatase
MLSVKNAVVDLRSATFVSLIIIFIAISALVASGVTSSFDSSVTDSIVRASGNPAMDTAMIVVSESASLFPSPMFIFALILIIRKKTRRVGAILLLVLAISTAAYVTIKRIVDRDRPPYDFKPNIGLDYVPEQDVISELASSFPSGHATRSAAFALVVSYMVRNRSVAGVPAGMLMWIIPVSVGFSRIYMGAHYPTDVIGGIVLGLIVANVMGKVLKFEAPR